MKQRLLRSLSAAFPPDSKRVMAPSGSIVASHTSLPLIVVTSFPRSGTHILIDLILNNFTPYRRNPLYVDLDRYIHEGLDVEDLIQKGGYVVKTHYPEPTFSANKTSDYEKIFSNAIILQPDRNPQDIFKSYQRMLGTTRQQTVEKDHLEYGNYWAAKNTMNYSFDALLDPKMTLGIVQKIASRLKIPRNARLIHPPDKRKSLSIYFRKFATRLLGNQISEVNTTVGFNTEGTVFSPSVLQSISTGARQLQPAALQYH